MDERYISCLRSEVAWSLLRDYSSKLAIEERSHWQLVLLRKFIKKKKLKELTVGQSFQREFAPLLRITEHVLLGSVLLDGGAEISRGLYREAASSMEMVF